MAEAVTSQSGTRPAQQEDLFELLLQPDIQQSMTTLVESLPRIANMVTALNRMCDVAKEALTDPALMGAVDDIVRERGQKYQERFRQLREAVQEAKRRAETSQAPIGLFGILRLLKEPVVQRNLRFFAALCEVMSEQERRTASPAR